MLKRIIQTTSDGSKTLNIPEWNESYHSNHGSLQEAVHVFINNGLNLMTKPEIYILEMGLGTGLNAFITLFESIKKNIKINYYTIEKYPVSIEELKELEYWNLIDFPNNKELFLKIHEIEWNKLIHINDDFYLNKLSIDFFELKNIEIPEIDLVYYDAFGARVQPYLWEEEIFSQLFQKMHSNSLLTTYSSKGSARRAMQAAGFYVEKKPGPLGKREMVNAWKKI